MLGNAAIAELLIREAETAEGHREKAFRRAAHAAFMCPVEANELVAAGRSPSELAGIGPSRRTVDGQSYIASPRDNGRRVSGSKTDAEAGTSRTSLVSFQ